eukprot:UN22752
MRESTGEILQNLETRYTNFKYFEKEFLRLMCFVLQSFTIPSSIGHVFSIINAYVEECTARKSVTIVERS